MIPLELQSLAQLATARMLNSAAAGVLLTGLVWAALRLLRRQNSGTRFAVWMLALVAVVSLPFFAGAGASATVPALQPLGELPTAFLLSRFWALYLFGAWAAGATLLLARLAAGLWRIHRLRSCCTEVEAASLAPETRSILHNPSHGRPVKLCLSTEVATPAVIGFFRPAIVFPAWLLPQLSAAELEIVLLHELAHLRRRDQWSNLAQKFLKALFFFHPAVWWIDSRLTLEREMACDDMVLAHRATPRAYASVLITLAEKLHSAPALALAQALVSRVRQISLRVSQILDGRRPRGTAMGKPVLSAGAVMLALVVGTAPHMPRLVAFSSPASTNPLHRAQAAGGSPSAMVPIGTPDTQFSAPEAAPPQSKEPQPTLAALRDSKPAMLPRPVMAADSTPAQVALNQSAPQPAKVAAEYRARNASAQEPAGQAPGSKPETVPAMNPQPAFGSSAAIVIVETTLVQDAGSGKWVVRIWTVEGDGSAAKQLESAIGVEI